jgi:RhtB (resistance to homoserine/threonine) family protein
MGFWQGFFIVTVVHLLAAASPGPDFALVTRQSLLHGRKAGIFASLGISLGLSIHILYSTAGLAAVIAHSAEWMNLVKIAGGSYLIFLGINGLRARQRNEVFQQAAQTTSNGPSFRHLTAGFFCNALNPKAPIYFLSLFTVVLSPNMPLPTLAVYGCWIMVLQMIWFTSLTYFLTDERIRSRLLPAGHWIDRTFGLVMVTLGIKVLTSSG